MVVVDSWGALITGAEFKSKTQGGSDLFSSSHSHLPHNTTSLRRRHHWDPRRRYCPWQTRYHRLFWSIQMRCWTGLHLPHQRRWAHNGDCDQPRPRSLDATEDPGGVYSTVATNVNSGGVLSTMIGIIRGDNRRIDTVRFGGTGDDVSHGMCFIQCWVCIALCCGVEPTVHAVVSSTTTEPSSISEKVASQVRVHFFGVPQWLSLVPLREACLNGIGSSLGWFQQRSLHRDR